VDDRCDRQTPRGVLSRSRRERRYGRRRRSTGDVRVGWELETDTTPDATGDNDFGEAKEDERDRRGYSRYVVSSLLQKAVRRSDEEIAAWAARELARSGYAWNLWDRLNLYVVEDLRGLAATWPSRSSATRSWPPSAGSPPSGRVDSVRSTPRWRGRPRARSTREASNADAYFSAVAEVRAEAHERDEEPAHDFPVGDLEPEGQFDAIFDGHTGEGRAARPRNALLQDPRRPSRAGG